MSSKAPPPLKQTNLFNFSNNPSFKLKVYTHNEIAEDGTVKQVSNKTSSSRPDCEEHVLDDSDLRNRELRTVHICATASNGTEV